MFLKSNRTNTKIESVIGPETEIEGNIRTNESIRIDGKIKGEVHAESVILGESGAILGDITANSVTIGGKVKGNIGAGSHLELLPKSQVFGDLRTSKLVIADGATFEGNCQMVKVDGQVVELHPSPDGENQHNQKALKVIAANGKRT